MTPAQLYAHGLKLIHGGDAYEGFGLLWESYKQEKNAKLAEDLAHCFFYGLGCTKDVLFGAKLLIENKLDEEIRTRMESHGHDGLTLKEVYLYGKYDEHKTVPSTGCVVTIEWVARSVYSSSNTKTKQATMLFVWWAQKENILPRDLRRLIGEMIWESRVDPDLWKVKI